ncbi:hypothetical protein G4B88_021708 [Cannabis sativa]|uniref:Uncharacterized protein n=1 Tax=Cannabis sativa TaxID=3483 RepID=A0A7J6FKX8_CANSA|nr:hypothetical protein G4B88_021708 [Cannabis sativa]
MCYRKLSEEQIKDLLRKKNFKEAIALVEELECEAEITKNMVSFVHSQVGFLLIFDLRFEEALCFMDPKNSHLSNRSDIRDTVTLTFQALNRKHFLAELSDAKYTEEEIDEVKEH